MEIQNNLAKSLTLIQSSSNEYKFFEVNKDPCNSFRVCLVCSDELNEKTSSPETSKLTLLRFTYLVNIKISKKFVPSLDGFCAPLCDKCLKVVGSLKSILEEIKELENSIMSTRNLIKEQVINGYEKTNKHRTLSGIAFAISSIRSHIKNEKSSAKALFVSHKHTDRKKRKRSGPRSDPPTSDHNPTLKSSFGRTVKRPKFYTTTNQNSFREVKSEQKFDPKHLYHCKEACSVKFEQPPAPKTSITYDENKVDSKLETLPEPTAGLFLSGNPEVQINFNLPWSVPDVFPNYGDNKKDDQFINPENGTLEKVNKDNKVGNVNTPKESGANCVECGLTFNDLLEKNKHLKTVHKSKNCKICRSEFDTPKDLKLHMKDSHPEVTSDSRKTFGCEFCDSVFKNHGDLLIHRRRHTGEKPFKCKTCNDSFISKSRYEVHIEVSHPSVPPLKCDYCPRSFFRHHRLKDHQKSHTGEKPFLCEICSQSFSQPAYLFYHQTTKHKELNLEQFKCDECDKEFASPVNLKFHKQTQHQNKYRYHCGICGHGATHMSHLKLHMRSHTGERPHSCNHCSKTFSRGSQLKIHIRSHTGERPYTCKTCDKSFTNSSKLRRHELTHVNNKTKTKSILKISELPSLPTAQSSADEFSEVIAIRKADISNQILKFEQQGDQEIQSQVIAISDPGSVLYQVISANDVISEPFTEFIVLNGEFI